MKRQISVVITFVVMALVVVFAWRNWAQMVTAFEFAKKAPPNLLFYSLALVGFGVLCASLAYRNLALHPVRFRELFVVENAAVFASRLLPAGVGGMGVHGVYLHKRRHTIAQATAIVAMNNTLGFVMHLCLLFLCFLWAPGEFKLIELPPAFSKWPIWLVVSALFGALVMVPAVKSRLRSALAELRVVARQYRARPQKLAWASLCLVGLTLSNWLILYLAWFAIAPDMLSSVGMVTVFVVLTMGIFLGAAVPTPGGLAGVEAGLVAGLTAQGLSFSAALAVALLFRVATYWAPLIPGLICLVYARQKKLV